MPSNYISAAFCSLILDLTRERAVKGEAEIQVRSLHGTLVPFESLIPVPETQSAFHPLAQ
jgi:hypothetical protein